MSWRRPGCGSAGREAELLPAEVDFLAGSQEQAARTLRLKRRNQVISVLGVAAMLLAVLALLAFRLAALQRDEARRNTRGTLGSIGCAIAGRPGGISASQHAVGR